MEHNDILIYIILILIISKLEKEIKQCKIVKYIYQSKL